MVACKRQFFFVGTEAEFIKIFPVIIECQKLGKTCHIIASGQNDLKKSRILDFIDLNGKFIELSQESEIKKTAIGLFQWFGRTRHIAISRVLESFTKDELMGVPWVVHGDTVSTFMGADIGRKLGCKVCHVEAGLRSHNLLNPFPEEIDRLLTSSKARLHFAPGEQATKNLKKARGQVVNTYYNTLLDSLNASKKLPILTEQVKTLTDGVTKNPYFVFVMHRQENIAKTEFFKEVMEHIKKNAEGMHCVLILHKITELKLEEIGLLEGLKKNSNFSLLPRVDYFDFMKLLDCAEYVITDGGSNQEELHYMGKPTLIMRETTERSEGIGQNAMLYGGNISMITQFAEDYKKYRIDKVDAFVSPSREIAEWLNR